MLKTRRLDMDLDLNLDLGMERLPNPAPTNLYPILPHHRPAHQILPYNSRRNKDTSRKKIKHHTIIPIRSKLLFGGGAYMHKPSQTLKHTHKNS